MLISYKGFVFEAQYHKGRDTWYIKYVPKSTNLKSMGRTNKASYNIGAYKSSDVAKADFTRLANHLLSGKYYKTFAPDLETTSLSDSLVLVDDVVVPEEAILVLASPAPEPVAFIAPKDAPGFLFTYIYL